MFASRMNLLGGFKLHYLPKIGCVWFLSTFILCYVIAVANGHVKPFIPFISECGTRPPESCIFGQMLNIGAVLMAVSMYVRYRQVDFAIHYRIVNLPKIWNELAFWTGNIICAGISIVGNFQATSLLWVHIIGGVMAFGTLSVYFGIQIRISASFQSIYRKYPKYGISKSMLYLRVFLSSLYFILLISIFFLIGKGMSDKGVEIFSLEQEHSGMELRKLAAALEWMMVFAFVIGASTIEKEFKSIEFEGIHFKSKIATLKTNVRKQK